jgi:ferredoxin
MVAPDIYLLNEDGYLELPETHVQQENEAITQRGARACPERAIEVIED